MNLLNLIGRRCAAIPHVSPSRNSTTTDRTLAFETEPLERRRMLAGTVKVVVRADSLIISGDGRDNEFEVVESNDMVVVRSLFGNGTEVIGGDTGVANADLQNVTIKTKGGDDYVDFGKGITVHGNATFITGGGDDLVDFKSASGGVTIDGKTTVKLGGGNDDLYFDGTTFGSDVTVIGGGGNDDVFVSAFTPIVDFQAGLNIKLGGGNDELMMDPTTVIDYSQAVLHGGGGFDSLSPGRAVLESNGADVLKFEAD